MEILNKIPESYLAQVSKKGVSVETIQEKANEFEVEGKESFPENVEQYVLERLDRYFSQILQQPNMKKFEALVIGAGKHTDNNNIARLTAKKYANLGIQVDEWDKDKKCKSGKKIDVIEGHYAFGFNQGDIIPDKPAWTQDLIVAMEQGEKLVLKTLVYNGDWIKDSKIESGKEIKFNVLENFDMSKDKIYPRNEYELTKNEYTEEEIVTYINENLKDYIKTGKEIVDVNQSGFVITKGNINTLDSYYGDFKVSFKDNSVMFSMENVIGTTVPENRINFTDKAENVMFIGKLRRDKDAKLFLDYMGSIVPEEFKKVELPQGVIESIGSGNLEEGNLLYSTDAIDDDSLL